MDEQSSWELKRRAATFSLVTNVALTALKVVAALLTGSISLLSEAVHSATDIAASIIAFASVRAAAAPPDEDHPFGHGKIESLAGFGESILLCGIVVYIVVEAAPRFLHPADIRFPLAGISVMMASGVACFAVGRYVLNVAKQDGLHGSDVERDSPYYRLLDELRRFGGASDHPLHRVENR